MIQPDITRSAIEQLIQSAPRRYRLMDWDAVREPRAAGRDPSLSFPFVETFQNLLPSCSVPHDGLREGKPRDGKPGRPYVYLKCGVEELPRVEAWLAPISKFVVCRDLLAVSMALDFDKEGGVPSKAQTTAAQLRARAKPYDRLPTGDCYAAANHLATSLLELIQVVEPYSMATLVMPMPPSSPVKTYDLPQVIAQQLAKRMPCVDGAAAVRTIKPRSQLKNLCLAEKLDALEGTIEVDADVVRGEVVLLVDDLYQSGVSMNFVGMKLLEAGARAILGLSVEKTCRNDDNTVKP